MPLPSSRLFASLADDVARLRAVAAPDLTLPVPTCPDWVVDDLVRHVANGLRNVALRRVRGQEMILRPDPSETDPIGAVEHAHADLVAELRRHPLDELATQPSANEPVETPYFWLRRMTHEIAIHRADAELAAHEPVTTVPPDLAVDGITEMLEVFLGYETHAYTERFADLLTDWRDDWLLLTAGGARWRIHATPAGIDTGPTGEADAPATVHGEPAALLLWLYHRGDDVTMTGDPGLIGRTRGLLDRAMS